MGLRYCFLYPTIPSLQYTAPSMSLVPSKKAIVLKSPVLIFPWDTSWFNLTWLCGFWHETVVVIPDGGMCKATTPCVMQSYASQWRARASRRPGTRVGMFHCDYALTWDLYLGKTISYMFMVIDYSLATQFYVPDDVPRALWPFTTGCVKPQLPSLWISGSQNCCPRNTFTCVEN